MNFWELALRIGFRIHPPSIGTPPRPVPNWDLISWPANALFCKFHPGRAAPLSRRDSQRQRIWKNTRCTLLIKFCSVMDSRRHQHHPLFNTSDFGYNTLTNLQNPKRKPSLSVFELKSLDVGYCILEGPRTVPADRKSGILKHHFHPNCATPHHDNGTVTHNKLLKWKSTRTQMHRHRRRHRLSVTDKLVDKTWNRDKPRCAISSEYLTVHETARMIESGDLTWY